MSDAPTPVATVDHSTPTEGVTMLRLDHEPKLGALTSDMRAQLARAWQDIAVDPSVRAVVLTGTGRGFCTGLDVAGAGHGGDPATEFRDASDLPVFGMSPHDFDVWSPYVVAVNGVCAGGGFHLLTEADIVIASETATFLDPHVAVGQVSALEPIALLRRMPVEAVLRMVVLGPAGRLDAAAALRVGLVSEVVADEDLVARAVQLASAAAKGSPAAIEASKRAIWQSMQVGLDEGLHAGWQAIRAHWSHPDYEEGIAAFVDRRPPKWARKTVS